MPRKKIEYRLATFDFETDPFQFGRTPKPFTVGVWDGQKYWSHWGDDCAQAFMAYLENESAEGRHYLLYAHNGGRFDFYYLLPELQNPVRLINGRIVSAKLGHHRLRDSFAVLPFSLKSTGEKLQIDYTTLERETREANRAEISAYLKQDCVALYQWVSKFREHFGDALTVGAASIKECAKIHPFARMTEAHDGKFRPYYFGGRVECFGAGVLTGAWQVYDVNSMYPFVMSHYLHPTGKDYEFDTNYKRALRGANPFFFSGTVISRGAFPKRNPDGPLTFPHGAMDVQITDHELRAALDLGLVDIVHCHGVQICHDAIKFDQFVKTWTDRKATAKQEGDNRYYTMCKYILNSCYGKFGTNSKNYKDHTLWREGDYWPGAEWSPALDYADFIIFERPAKSAPFSYFDVATAASITGASRAVLMRALANAERPAYCDTDSIICEGLHADLHDSRLGAWKLEARGDTLALGGKKLYTLTNNGEEVKSASKGVALSSKQIFDIANGGVHTSYNQAPTFSLARPLGDFFVKREVRSHLQ